MLYSKIKIIGRLGKCDTSLLRLVKLYGFTSILIFLFCVDATNLQCCYFNYLFLFFYK